MEEKQETLGQIVTGEAEPEFVPEQVAAQPAREEVSVNRTVPPIF